VNASDADRCSAVWADDGVLMPPHHPSVLGHEAIAKYFRGALPTQRLSGRAKAPNRLKTLARACTCTGVSQTGRGSSRTISGIAIEMCPLSP
jgi:hypothetical protein